MAAMSELWIENERVAEFESDFPLQQYGQVIWIEATRLFPELNLVMRVSEDYGFVTLEQARL